jgi:transposase
MPRHRSYSIDFKRMVVAEYHAGETLHALGRRHDLSRNLIRIWMEKVEAGALDQDMASAELLSEYEARVEALERLVGRQALEIEFLERFPFGLKRFRDSQLRLRLGGRWRYEPAFYGGTVRGIDLVGDPLGCGAPCDGELRAEAARRGHPVSADRGAARGCHRGAGGGARSKPRGASHPAGGARCCDVDLGTFAVLRTPRADA